MSFSLETHGDRYEQAYWAAFLRDDFPTYGVVWAEYVAPLTGRPDHLHFKTDEDLAQIRRGHEDVCNAQLHYTTLTHLTRVYDLRQTQFPDFNTFIEAIVRLAAATDTADELLARISNRGAYDAWDESRAARSAWRKGNGYPEQPLRDYRNRLLHGRLPPYVDTQLIGELPGEVFVPGRQRQLVMAPKIGTERGYLDWRRILPPTDPRVASERMDADFEYGMYIVRDAWERVLAYFEREWQRTLVPRLRALG